jgi:5-methylcytosine-specific restriction endonuclease McrA
VKECSRCHQVKPLDAFSPHPRGPHGRQWQCKVCRTAAQRVYAASAAGRAKHREWAARPDVKERTSAKQRAAYLDKVGGTLQRLPQTPERLRAKRQRHYQKHREYYAEKNARWVRGNPLANRLRRARRRARLAGAEGTFTKAEWLALLDKYGRRCLCCGSTENLEPDHVVPVVKGGSNWITNIQPLCRSCNASKKDRTIDYRPVAAP